jgi:hypothetical protein
MQISQTLFLGNKLLYSSEVNRSINKTESEFYAATYFITLLDPTKLSRHTKVVKSLKIEILGIVGLLG